MIYIHLLQYLASYSGHYLFISSWIVDVFIDIFYQWGCAVTVYTIDYLGSFGYLDDAGPCLLWNTYIIFVNN